MTGLSSPPAVYTPVALETLAEADHQDGLHETDRAAIRMLYLEAWALARPLIINGNMQHWQRKGSGSQTSTTTYSKSTSYNADRMFVLPAGASVTQARSTTIPNARSQYSLAITGASSVTTVDIGQRIRSSIINTRGLQSLVFSCYVCNESGAAYTPTLRIGTPGATDDFTTVTNRLNQSLQQCADSAWTLVYHVFDPSAYTNIANGMEVVLRIPSGSSVSGDTNRIAQFDLRPGSALATYLPPDPELELLLARGYYRTYGPGGTNVAFATGLSNSTSSALYTFPVSPPMRSTPTIELSAASDFSGFDNGTPVALNSMVIGAGSPDTLQLSATQGGTTWTQWRPNLLLGSTSAVLALNAEL